MFNKALQIDPNNFKALNNMGFLEQLSGNYRVAVKLY